MLSSTFLTALVLPFALASPLARRDAASIVSSINTIESNIATLNNTLNGFHKNDLLGLPKVLQIQQQTDSLGDSINAATSAASASSPLNDTDSNTVALAVLALEPQIFSLLDNIVSKKPVFDSVILGVGSVSPQVEQDLKQQNASSAALGQAITAKLSSVYAGVAPVITGQIAAAFDKAIATYATSGGLFSVGPLPSFAAFKAAVQKASATKL